jgi:hypothetical protein
MRLRLLCVSLAVMLFVLPALRSGQQPIDGANTVFADPLLDKIVGHGYDKLSPLDAANRSGAAALVQWLRGRGAKSAKEPTAG